MAEVKIPDEPTLPTKRTLDTTVTESLSTEPKKPKPNSEIPSSQPQPHTDVVSNETKPEEKGKHPEEVEEEEVNGEDVIDRKGKGILIEEDEDDLEGIDESDSDSDSDSESDSDSGIGDGLSDDSDFADDPLAEVDLDNILPSRTRRKIIHPGVYLATNLPPEDSDESDDPDAA